MGSVGLGVQGQHAVAVEVEELAGMGVEEAAGYHGLGRVGVALGVEPVGAAEVGDAAFRGYAGTAEEHHAARRALVDPLTQLLDIAFRLVDCHGSSFPHPFRTILGFPGIVPDPRPLRAGFDRLENPLRLYCVGCVLSPTPRRDRSGCWRRRSGSGSSSGA